MQVMLVSYSHYSFSGVWKKEYTALQHGKPLAVLGEACTLLKWSRQLVFQKTSSCCIQSKVPFYDLCSLFGGQKEFLGQGRLLELNLIVLSKIQCQFSPAYKYEVICYNASEIRLTVTSHLTNTLDVTREIRHNSGYQVMLPYQKHHVVTVAQMHLSKCLRSISVIQA